VTYITLRQLAPQNSEEMMVVRGQEGIMKEVLNPAKDFIYLGHKLNLMTVKVAECF
jgi:hypothetical protein